MFSLGNESNYGDNFAAMSNYIREREGVRTGFRRLIHYENTYNNNPQKKDPDTVDVVSRMYWTPGEMQNYHDRFRRAGMALIFVFPCGIMMEKKSRLSR